MNLSPSLLQTLSISLHLISTIIICIFTYQIYKVYSIANSKLILFGWFFKLVLIITSLSVNLRFEISDLIINNSLIFTSFFFFYGSIEYFIKKDLKNEKVYILIGSIILIILYNASFITSLYSFDLIILFIHSISLIFLTYHYKKIEKEFTVDSNFLYLGMLLYTICSFLSIMFREHSMYSSILSTISVSAKILIAIGLYTILTYKLKLYSQEKKLANELNSILGRTLHEITYPIISVQEKIEEVLISDKSKFSYSAKTGTQLNSIQIDINLISAVINATRRSYSSNNYNDNSYEPSHTGKRKLEFVSLNTLLEISIINLKASTKKEVDFKRQYSKHCVILCVPSDLIQVFNNLIKNSIDAISEKTLKGIISIKTIRNKVEGNLESIDVEISDNGKGIPRELIDHIFNEGFSTKEKGTIKGLGLTITKNILSEYGASINVYSPINKNKNSPGSVFVLSFPAKNLTYA